MELDHFVGYKINDRVNDIIPRYVNDQILKKWTEINIKQMDYFAVTASKDDEEKKLPNYHLAWYEIGLKDFKKDIMIKNQLTHEIPISLTGPLAILVPTFKIENDHPAGDPQDCLDHYLVYQVFLDLSKVDLKKKTIKNEVYLDDQFIPKKEKDKKVKVIALLYFAVPCGKTKEKPEDPDKKPDLHNAKDHLAIYSIELSKFDKNDLNIDNQFGKRTINVGNRWLLFVPTEKSEAKKKS
jgi:hypothetical protein